MYMVTNWEVVYGVHLPYTALILPNLGSYSLMLLYFNVLRRIIIRARELTTLRIQQNVRPTSKSLPFAGRQVHPRLHPLLQRALGIANRTTDLHEGRSVASHAGFGEPRFTHVQKDGRFAWGKERLAMVRLRRRPNSSIRRRYSPISFVDFAGHWSTHLAARRVVHFGRS